MKQVIAFLIVFFIVSSCNVKSNSNSPNSLGELGFELNNPQGNSLLNEPLISPDPSEPLVARWKEKKEAFTKDPDQIDNIIWYGRFTAYMGNYNQAIEIYTKGLKEHPDDPRLYRHRGHRFITLRQFDKAILDFEKAKLLIDGKENEIEPDGMPNAQNIPVSTLHGNIYYHLGLAYYLKDDLPNALKAYESCLKTSRRPDNVVSAVHWLYMILQRMGNKEEAFRVLDLVSQDFEIIENQSYFKLCLFYKGLIDEGSLIDPGDAASANDAVKYGVANWHLYNDNEAMGLKKMEEIITGPSWASFGYIAAEVDLANLR